MSVKLQYALPYGFYECIKLHRYLPEVNKYRVIHSMHASYSELCDFVAYLKPKRIIPCVIPFGDASLMDVCTR